MAVSCIRRISAVSEENIVIFFRVLEHVLTIEECVQFVAEAETKGFAEAMFGGQVLHLSC